MSDIPLKTWGDPKELVISMEGKVVARFPIDLGKEPLKVTLTGVTPDENGQLVLPPGATWDVTIDRLT
jgi:hypothetical protein